MLLSAFPKLLLAQGADAAPAPAPAPAKAEEDDLELPASGAESAPGSSSAPAEGPAPANGPPPATPPSGAPDAKAAAPAAAGAGAAPSASAPVDAKPVAGSGSEKPADRTQPHAVPRGLLIDGFIQAEYQASQLSEDQLQQGGAPLNQDRFLIRRARIRIDRGWDYASGTLELDANTTNGVSVGIRRAEASLLYRGKNPDEIPPLVMLTAGVTDLPFGYELLESAKSRVFMERTLGSSALYPTEADVGLKVSGAAGFLRYALSLSNGEPVNNRGFPTDPNAAKDLTGRVGVDVKATPEFGAWGGVSVAQGKGFHPGTDAGKSRLVWRDLNEDGIQTPDEVAGVPASSATPSKNFDRWAIGLDAGATLETPLGKSKLYGEVFVASNYDRGQFEADPVATGIDVREAGAYVAALQEVTRFGVAGFRAAVYDGNSDLLEQRQGRLLPLSQAIWTLSPLVGLVLEGRARLTFQYDIVLDELGRDERGVPTDAENDKFTARLQVDL